MITHIDNLEQGSPEWLKERMGIMTASVVKNLLTSKFARSKDKKIKILALEMAAQRLTQKVVEPPRTRDMERGHIEEDLAKLVYNENYNETYDVGFITSTDLGFKVGFSPDGLIEDEGFIEVKSRLPKYQVKTIFSNEVPDEYVPQIQMGFLVSGRKWCDFIQYSNGMPLFVKRVEPDFEIIESIKGALIDFEETVSEAIDAYNENAKQLVPTEFVKHDFATAFVGEGD